MEKEYTIKDLRREKLLTDKDMKQVSGAGMEAGLVEGVCPQCGATIWIHVYETNAIQRINTRCEAEGCTYSFDYYFFKE